MSAFAGETVTDVEQMQKILVENQKLLNQVLAKSVLSLEKIKVDQIIVEKKTIKIDPEYSECQTTLTAEQRNGWAEEELGTSSSSEPGSCQ